MSGRLSALLQVRPGEEHGTRLLVLTMMLMTMGGAIGSPGVSALFLSRIGAEFLPSMYIGLAGLTMATTLALTALLGRVPRKRLYVGLPVLMGLLLTAARFVVSLDPTWIYPALWLGMFLFWTLTFLVAWGLAGMVFDTRQAKRLFPLLAAAGILGTTIGGLITRPLVGLIGSENLLLGWALALFLAVVPIVSALGDAQEALRRSKWDRPSLVQDVQRGYQFVRESELMRWVSAGALLMGTLLFFVAFPFSRGVTEQLQSEDAIAGFLGAFEGLATAAAFLASLLLANRIYARVGFMGALLIFPLVYLLGFTSAALYPVFATIAALRFAQIVWRLGVADSAYQAVFSLVPAERREPTRAFINGVPMQIGVAMAGVVLLISESTLAPSVFFSIAAALAALAAYVLWRASRTYRGALAQALESGQPHVFFDEERPFGGYRHDAFAVSVVVAGMSDEDPGVRRVSAEILGNLPVPEATQAMVEALDDPDPAVRAALLRSLNRAGAIDALLDVSAHLADPEPGVRLEAIETLYSLAGYRPGLLAQLEPLLSDPAPEVRSCAAITILKGGAHPRAPEILEDMWGAEDPETRIVVLQALDSWGDPWGWEFAEASLDDSNPSVRRAAARAAASIDPETSVDLLIEALGDEDRSVQATAADALGGIGLAAVELVVDALEQPRLEAGALVAIGKFPARSVRERLLRYGQGAASRAGHYHRLWLAARGGSSLEAELFAHSLRAMARRNGRNAVTAIGLLTDPDGVALALENLDSREPAQRANALEVLDSLGHRSVISQVIPLWESAPPAQETDGYHRAIAVALSDDDDWLRACAALAAQNAQFEVTLSDLLHTDPDPLVREAAQRSLDGGQMMKVLPTLSIMERILFLQRVPLFADLPPSELKQVAAIAYEHVFNRYDEIARQGELGDEMYIIVDGEVAVLADVRGNGLEVLAVRGPGEYVGEMSIISHEPRMASLRASTDVRMLCIGQKEFEGIIRERPETSLAVIRELIERLKEAQGIGAP